MVTGIFVLSLASLILVKICFYIFLKDDFSFSTSSVKSLNISFIDLTKTFCLHSDIEILLQV